MKTLAIVAVLTLGASVGLAPDVGHAKVTKREFYAAAQYCRIPAQFRRGPFLAKPLFREVPVREVQKRCSPDTYAAGPFGVDGPVVGCAKLQGANCVVYLPREVRGIAPDIFQMIIEHELAHCRGWIHGP